MRVKWGYLKMTAQQNKQPKKVDETNTTVGQKTTCGIIMPIATMSPEYTAEHWEDVRAIIDTAIERAGFEPRIVSDSEDSTIIHKSIINNIYHDEIIVCDVSNKNANVMFELGMRLAFNKPVVIIKDDKTGYSFDTSNIEHVGYRKDLRHNTVEKFINDLARKIKATHEAPSKENYQPFLSHFGKFEVAKIENKSIEGSEALEKLLNKFSAIETQLNQINIDNAYSRLEKNILKTFKKSNNIVQVILEKPLNSEIFFQVKDNISNNISDVIDVKFDFLTNSIEVIFSKPISALLSFKIQEDVKNIISIYS